MTKLTFFGDFKVDSVNFLHLSSELESLLKGSEINVVNFEAPISSDGKPIIKSGPNIYQHPDAPKWLETQGFNAISMANNHALDFGENGLEMALEKFNEATIMGVGSWDEAYKVHIFETSDNKKIGIVCCTHCEFGTLTDKYLCYKGCAWSLSPEIARMIKNSRGEVDTLIVYNHGGMEYMEIPLPEWREIYKMWLDLGADAVIASHPHVPQGSELYNGKPICYSLGNFCFDKKKRKLKPRWNESLCCILDINELNKVDIEIVPIIYDASHHCLKINYSKEFAEHLQSLNDILQDEDKYIQAVNEKVLQMLPRYMGLFSRGGFVTGVFQKEFAKGFAEGIMGRGFFRRVHAMNNIQCETHRWAILRAMNLKK